MSARQHNHEADATITADIRPLLADWPYRPSEISVRKIVGADGQEKIQLRLDLGLIQMNTTGRPDGHRPHGYESLLHWHLERLEQFKRRGGTDVGFLLTPEECEALREEAILYYQRYLSLFALEDYEGVERDTARNLEVLVLCRRYGAELADRLALEQYRPYIIMMNRRAAAMRLLREHKPSDALEAIDEGLRLIREFFEEYGHAEAFEECREVAILRSLKHQIEGHLPTRRLEDLQRLLLEAVREERYEDAARLRDQINRLIGRTSPSKQDHAE